MSNNVKITKGPIVVTTDKEDIENGIVAFQIVYFEIDFFGAKVETDHDTKIMKDGRQIVMGGCGFIKDGYLID